MSSGRLFQSFGPAEANERSPTVTRRDGRMAVVMMITMPLVVTPGWIATVPGDKRHARCRYCCVLLNAHRNDLLKHSRSSKHATNIAFGRAYSDDELASEVIAKSVQKLKEKKQRMAQKRSRFRKLPISLSLCHCFALSFSLLFVCPSVSLSLDLCLFVFSFLYRSLNRHGPSTGQQPVRVVVGRALNTVM